MNTITPKSAIAIFAPIGYMTRQDKNEACRKDIRHIKSSASASVQMSDDKDKLVMCNDKIDSTELNKSVNKSAKVCFGGFFNANFYKNDLLKKSLGFAGDNGALFLATVAFVTGAIIRPLAIFATPDVKKENKEYASANAISSSFIGLALMTIASTPIAQAIKKINKNPEKFLKASTIRKLHNEKTLLDSSKYKFATQIFKTGSDFVCAIPKAILTCALIPPIISALFRKNNKGKDSIYPKSVISFNSIKQYKNSEQIFQGFIKEGKNEN